MTANRFESCSACGSERYCQRLIVAVLQLPIDWLFSALMPDEERALGCQYPIGQFQVILDPGILVTLGKLLAPCHSLVVLLENVRDALVIRRSFHGVVFPSQSPGEWLLVYF